MNIAIMVCKKLTFECSGSWCFKAFAEKDKSFAIYKSEIETNLCGFFHCNGCGSNLDKELEYKVTQLKKVGVKTVHISKCIEVECDRYNEVRNFLLRNDFNVIDGTH